MCAGGCFCVLGEDLTPLVKGFLVAGLEGGAEGLEAVALPAGGCRCDPFVWPLVAAERLLSLVVGVECDA